MYVNNYDSVADVYDIYNQADYDLDFYIRRYQSFKGQAIEFMAGTGRLAVPLLKAGLHLDCVDISGGLLERLAEKVRDLHLQSDIYHSDIRTFQPKKTYELVIIGFNSLSEIIEAKDRESVFQSVYANLNPGGEFVFSLYNPSYRRRYISNALTLVNEYEHGDSKILFFMTSQENDHSIVDAVQLYEFYNAEGCLTRKKMMKLKFQLISRPEIESLVLKTGFIITEFFGNYDGSPYSEAGSPFMIYVLTK